MVISQANLDYPAPGNSLVVNYIHGCIPLRLEREPDGSATLVALVKTEISSPVLLQWFTLGAVVPEGSRFLGSLLDGAAWGGKLYLFEVKD